MEGFRLGADGNLDDSIVEQGRSIDVLATLADESVDFCYIDPPFMTQKKRTGPKGTYSDTFADVQDYQGFLREHLVEAHRILKPHGTIMVHIDPRVSHYVRLVLDEVFGFERFINEIAWCYRSGGAGKRTLAKKHDTILFYGKTKHYRFNVVREPYPHAYKGDAFHPDGRMLNDWWDISMIATSASERCGYPTQKPLPLMRRILEVATNPGDIVLDFFCGSGTTGVACLELDRRFILVDENPVAISHVVDRLGWWDAEEVDPGRESASGAI